MSLLQNEWISKMNTDPVSVVNDVRARLTDKKNKFSDIGIEHQIEFLLFYCRVLLFHLNDETYPPVKQPEGTKVFVPKNRYEEILLILNIINFKTVKDLSLIVCYSFDSL